MLILSLVGVLVLGVWFITRPKSTQPNNGSEVIVDTPSTEKTMKLESPTFTNNTQIPAKYTCKGENISPPLLIKDVPEEAQSLVLMVEDPDAPMKTWLHWTVWNIDPKTTDIAEGTTPEGSTQGLTDFGATGYGGPCPPSGTHRYLFKLMALDTVLDLTTGASLNDLKDATNGHILAESTLIGLSSK